MKNITNKRIVIFSNNSSFLNSHRLELIKKLISLNNIITIIANFDEKIPLNKINFIDTKIQSSSSFIDFIKLFFILKKTLKIHNYDLVHSIGIKTNLLTLIFSLFHKDLKYILHFTGLGNIFSLKKFYLIKYLISFIFIIFDNDKCNYIFQKKEDLKKINIFNTLKSKNIYFIPGSGVNTAKFKKTKLNNKKKIKILMSSRMIKGKGIDIYLKIVNAFKDNDDYIFYFAGKKNVSGIGFKLSDYEYLFKSNKNFIYLSDEKNMSQLLKSIDIVVYPSSYAEGIPKFLLETLSCGIPIICSDNPANYYIVDDGINGSIVKNNNINDYKNKILFFSNFDLRRKVSKYSRIKCNKNFDINLIIDYHLKYYHLILKND